MTGSQSCRRAGAFPVDQHAGRDRVVLPDDAALAGRSPRRSPVKQDAVRRFVLAVAFGGFAAVSTAPAQPTGRISGHDRRRRPSRSRGHAGPADRRIPGPSRDARGRVAGGHRTHRGGRRRGRRRRPRRGGRQRRAQAGFRHRGDRRRPLAHGIDYQIDDGDAARGAGGGRTALGRRRADRIAARGRDGGRQERLHAGST